MALQPINVNNKELSLERAKSSLRAGASIGDTTLNVYSITQFAINYILCVGPWGSEGTEIIKTHTATAPSGNTVTLASALTKNHPKDTPVYILAFDQVEFGWGDEVDEVTPTVLSLTNINPEMDEMVYEDTAHTSGYYFNRYKNSITSVYSNYSDGVPYTGLPENTVGYAIDTAMNELYIQFDEKLNYNMALGLSNQFMTIVRGEVKGWAEFQKYDEALDTLDPGMRRIAVPTDLYDKNTNKSIMAIRIGNGDPLDYIDRNEYLEKTRLSAFTTIATQPAVGATSLVLANTANLPDEGSIDVYYSGTKYNVSFTGNTRSTGTLTGIETSGDGSIEATFSVGSNVWYNVTESVTDYYSIWDGYIYFWPLASTSSDYQNRTIFADYLTDIESVSSDMDEIVSPRKDALIQFLKWKFRAIKENNGKEDMKDPSYLQYRSYINNAIRTANMQEINVFRPRGFAVTNGRGRRRTR